MIGWTIFGIVLFGAFVVLVMKMREYKHLPYLTDDKIDPDRWEAGSEADRSGIRKRRRL